MSRHALTVQEHPRANGKRKRVPRYVLIVERALGRYLDSYVVIHHANLNEADDSNSNLVVCQDRAYHNLLHQRTRAYFACGNANALRCDLCKRYDLEGTNGMVLFKRRTGTFRRYHKACDAASKAQSRNL